MKNWKMASIAVGVAAVILMGLPFLIPMDHYIARVEQIASEKLGAPVAIGDIQIGFLPSPRLNISDIRVGENADLRAETVSVVPAIRSLFSDVKVISTIQIRKPLIQQSALEYLTALTAAEDESSPSRVEIRHVELREAQLEWPELRLPLLDADVALGENNAPESVKLKTDGDVLAIEFTPEGERQLIKVDAETWKLPLGPPFLLNQLRMEMTLADGRLELTRLHAKLYGGELNMQALMRWGRRWQLDGELKISKLAVSKPTALISQKTKVSGQLFASGNFGSSAKDAGHLLGNLKADIAFRVDSGVLYGVDLARAATLLLRQGQRGGETAFDELSGQLKLAGRKYQLKNLKVTSGLMLANGNVKIDADQRLDGVIDVELKRSISLAAIPLKVSGTLDNPSVFPTKAAMAGAAAGTAIMGPGLGTTLGVKAGNAVDKLRGLFGDDKDE